VLRSCYPLLWRFPTKLLTVMPLPLARFLHKMHYPCPEVVVLLTWRNCTRILNQVLTCLQLTTRDPGQRQRHLMLSNRHIQDVRPQATAHLAKTMSYLQLSSAEL